MIEKPKKLLMTKEFNYPDIYNFPPFFTLQPNLDTWGKQCEIWISLILNYAKHHRKFIIYLDSSEEQLRLFTNKTINRALPKVAQQTIFKRMIELGLAELVSNEKYYIYYRTLREWADLLERWIVNIHSLNTSLKPEDLILYARYMKSLRKKVRSFLIWMKV